MINRFSIIFIVFSFLLSAQLSAQNRSSVINGARTASMGGAFTAVEGNIFSPAYNSAALASLPSSSAVVSGAFGFGNMSFVSVESMPNIRVQNNWQFNYSAVAIPFAIKNMPVAAALSYRPVYEFDNEFTTEGVVPRKFSEEGGINALSAALAVQISSDLSIGAIVNYMYGTFRQNINGQSEEFSAEESYKGYSFDIGALYKIDNDFSVGLNIFLPHTLSNDPALSGQPFSDIPTFANIGIAYKMDKKLLLVADFHYRPWSNSGDFSTETEESKNLKDINSFHIGIEYIYEDGEAKLPLRAGIYSNPHFAKTDMEGDQATGFVFSGGAGLYLGSFNVDGAVSFETLDYWEGVISSEVLKNSFKVMIDLYYTMD